MQNHALKQSTLLSQMGLAAACLGCGRARMEQAFQWGAGRIIQAA